jgi:uncharacterized damage-inducible protein DinB
MRSDFHVSHSPVVAAAVQANLVILARGAELIGRLSAESYNRKLPACFNSSIGGHFRHVIEHYQGLWAAQESGDIDYENRARDNLIETDPDYALGAVETLQSQLRELSSKGIRDRTLRMGSETVAGEMLVTSLTRELEFLISHTIHHYALIAVIAGHQDVALPSDFGVAPSTLKYQQTGNAACAR